MGWQDRDYARGRDLAARGRVVPWLIGITVLAWIVQGAALGRGGSDLARILGVVPSRFIGDLWLWQAFTHVFLHQPGGVLHLAFNMLFLYWLGSDIAEIHGTRRFLGLYFGGAATCAIAYVAAGYATGRIDTPAIGATGAIMAVSIVTAFYFPNRIIHVMLVLPVPLWLLVTAYVALDLYYPLAGLRPWTASAGTLGGALFGLAFWKARQWSLPGLRLSFGKSPPPPAADEVDRILDKINAQGIGSLTDGERETLKRAAK